MRWFRRHYGAGPLHLLSLLASFALAGYIVSDIHQVGNWQRILIWLGAAIVGHDAILFPLYAVADRTAGWLDARRRPARLPAVPWINHLRVPVVVSAVLLAVSWPLVLARAPATYMRATGLTVAPYEHRYLAVVAVLFVGSALLYAVRLGRASSAARTSTPPPPHDTPPTPVT